MKTCTISLDKVRITGYETDYILQTIEKSGDFYEGPLLKKWTPLFSDVKYILDIGANLGNHTLYWATELSAEQIVSFEPFPDNYALLSQNINQNNLYHVKAIQKAISDRTTDVVVKSFSENNYGGTTFEYADAGNGENAIQTCSIDEVFPKLGMPRLDFAKIDTEGFEIAVLNGMMCTIDRYKPVIWVEVSGETVRSVYSMLVEQGYSLIDVSGANLLFIPSDRVVVPCITFDAVLENNVALTDKVNQYYANYEKAKGWVSEKETKIQQMNAEYELLKEKLNKAQQDYATCKEWLQNRNQQLENALEAKSAAESALLELQQALADADAKYVKLSEDKSLSEESLKLEIQNALQENDRLMDSYVQLQERFKKSEDNYQTCKLWLSNANRKVDLLTVENTELKAQIETLRQTLTQTDAVLVAEVTFLAEARNKYNAMNTELRQTKWKAKRYDIIKDKLYNTWYGKLAMIPLKVLRRIKKLFHK